jgi:hypothetical protein
MRKETMQTLSFIIGQEYWEEWLNGYNKAFNMTPQQMINLGREDEVVQYLEWAAYGPW